MDTGLAAEAVSKNPRASSKQNRRAREAENPSLAGPLPIPFRLIGIDLAHALEQIARVRLRNIRRFRAATVALFGTPRRGTDRFLRPIGHGENLKEFTKKARRRE